MEKLTTEVALNVLIDWLQDNIDCGNMIIFDNDEDNTDSAVLLPRLNVRVRRSRSPSSSTSATDQYRLTTEQYSSLTHNRQPSPAGALLYIRNEIMSELTLTKPEVLTGHTDVICSTSIERIVTGRNAALAQIEVLMQQLDDVSMLTRSLGEKPRWTGL